MDFVSFALRQSVIDYARRTADAGLVVNTQGNVSVRDPDTNLIAITPHDLPYGNLTADHVVIVDMAGRKVAGDLDVSYETPVHCAVYRARPDVYALIHTEPTYTNCLGAVGKPIEPVVYSLLFNLGGAIPIMPYMPSGTDAFGQAMLKVMKDGHAVVWANHGLLVAGRTVDEAFRRTMIIEHAAQIYHLALLHGQPTIVTPAMAHGAVA